MKEQRPTDAADALSSGTSPAALPHADADAHAQAPAGNNALPKGTRIREFEILGLIGEGGFGIVYLAHDHSLDRKVALKEYMPGMLAMRAADNRVLVRSARNEDTFRAGLKSFINEARLLARFDNPALVKVYRFWEDNDTAYMVMPYYRGDTLKQTITQMSAPPDEAWLRSLLISLLGALQVIHEANCVHRDIAPDNILILEDGRPLLLDFGAARLAISGMAQAFTVILKPGYAPIEQYAEAPSMAQGPWTDIYALGAVMHFAIAKAPPVPSVARMTTDTLEPLARRYRDRYSVGFLRLIDRCLAIRAEDRPQSAREFLDRLLAEEDGNSTGGSHGSRNTAAWRRRSLAWAAAAVLMLGLAAGIYKTVSKRSAGSTPVVQGSARPEGENPVTSAPAAPTAPASPETRMKLAMDAVLAGASSSWKLEAFLEQPRVVVGKDRLRFRIQSSASGYLYILMLGSDEKQIVLLFPNSVDQDNRIAANMPLHLPRPSWHMEAAGPPGIDRFVAVVSGTPREYAISADGAIDFAREEKGKPALAGVPACRSAAWQGAGTCDESYGAAAFSIEEVSRP